MHQTMKNIKTYMCFTCFCSWSKHPLMSCDWYMSHTYSLRANNIGFDFEFKDLQSYILIYNEIQNVFFSLTLSKSANLPQFKSFRRASVTFILPLVLDFCPRAYRIENNFISLF